MKIFKNTKFHHYDKRRGHGFSLVEMLTVLALIGIVAALCIPHMGPLSGAAKEVKDKRNAKTVLFSYQTGSAAGVRWPSGDVSVIVAAVVAGQMPASGVYVGTLFRANVSTDELSLIYRYIGKNAGGELFYDPTGSQNASGH